VLSRYGNADKTVTAADVALAREGGPKAPLAVMAKFTIPAIILLCVLIGLAVMALISRRRKGA
jgi:Na+/H+-dicarboxylate symporter